MTTTRKTRATSKPTRVSEDIRAPLIKASAEGAMAVCSVFGRGGNTLWLGGRVIEIGRDELSGDMVLRAGGEESFVTSHDLATIAGMSTAAAIIQAQNEERNR